MCKLLWGGGFFGDQLTLVIGDEVITLESYNTGDRTKAFEKAQKICNERNIKCPDEWKWDGTL